MNTPATTLRKLLFAATLAAGLGTAHALPQGGPMHERGGPHADAFGGDGMPGPGQLRGMMRGLDLSEAQRDQIFELMHKQQPILREKMKEVRKGREALRAAATSGSYDAQKTRALADAQAKLIADLIVMRTETLGRMHALLTPEQQKKFAEHRPMRRH